ncbi:MAG TPA: fibronectin type III domain-containing protein [Iamia sp.]
MAPTARRTTVVALVVTLLAGVLALTAPGAPAGAATVVQTGVKPSDPDCQSGRLHVNGATPGTIGTCGGITITGAVKVNGGDVVAGTSLAIGDVVTVSVVVTPQGGHSAMYAETVDGIRHHQYDTDAVIPIGLPSQTGTLLSSPADVTMSRTDNGDRGNGPAINCLAQNGQDAARTDGATGITLGAGPVGQNGMRAAVSGSALTAKWTTMAADRCVNVVSNNGFYPGQSISFTQTVLSLGAAIQTPTWSLGGLTLQLDDASRTLTWGSAKNVSLSMPAPAPTAPGAPTGVTAVGGNGQATVSWTTPLLNGGSPITGYRVTPSIDGVAQTPQAFTGGATSRTVTGLANGTAYTFTVAATNAVGTGAESAASAAVTPATVPGAPTGVTATPLDGGATVGWTAPAATGGSPITSYRVTPIVGGVPQTAVTFPAGLGTSQAVGDLLNGSAYTFTVAATNAAGTGPASVPSAPVTPRAPWAPFATADDFTRQQHLDLAGREPSPGELTAWHQALLEGTPAAELVESLRTAPYWDGTLGPIVRLYEAIYLRDPDTAGLQYWEGEIRSGRRTINQMAAFVAQNAEFRALYGTLGDAAFVTKVYDLVLGRSPSPADMTYWTGELLRGQGRGRMVLLFSGSTEYKARSADRVAVVLIRYGMLGRVGTTSEVDAGVALLTGATTEAVVAAILASPEYATRVL